MSKNTYAGKISNKSSQFVEAIFKQKAPKGSKKSQSK